MEEEGGIEEMLGQSVLAFRNEARDTLTIRLNPQNIAKAVLNEDLKGKIAKSIGRMKEITVNALQLEATKGLQALQTAPDSSIQAAIATGQNLQDTNEAISQKLQALVNAQEQLRTDCEEERKLVAEAQYRLADYANQIDQKRNLFMTNCTRKAVVPLHIRDCIFEGVVTRLCVINFKKGSLGEVYLKIVGDGKEELNLAIGTVRPGAQEIRVEEVVAFYNTAAMVEYTLVRGNQEYWEPVSNSFALTLNDQEVGNQPVVANSLPSSSQYPQVNPPYGYSQPSQTDPLRELAIKLQSHFTAQSEEGLYQWLQKNPQMTYEYIIANIPGT